MPIEIYPPVIGQPFRAESNSRRTETRPDGKQVTYEYHGIIARDSQGRVFQGTTASPRVPERDGRTTTFIRGGGSITDPAAKVRLEWNDTMKIVTKMPLLPAQTPETPRPLGACERESGGTRSYPNGETQRIESLGERTIQGIATRGCRVSTLVPAGVLHNEQPITITDDSWSSPELRITLLRIHHDPSGNDEIIQLDNIVRAEPDAFLFRPPQNYALRDPEQEELEREAAQPPISHPEFLAGPWETEPDSSGTIDGIHLRLSTTLQDSGEHLSLFEIGVYRRQGQVEKRNWFTANDRGGATWDGSRLQLKFESRVAGELFLVLNLAFDPGQSVWAGTYARNGVSKQVRLKRPGGFSGPSLNRFVGEWYLHLDRSRPLPQGAYRESYCLHVAQRPDGSMVAWEDRKLGRFIPYGAMLKVLTVENNSMTLTNMTDDFPGGNVRTLLVTFSLDGSRLEMKSSTNGAPNSSPPRILMKSTGEGFSSPSSGY